MHCHWLPVQCIAVNSLDLDRPITACGRSAPLEVLGPLRDAGLVQQQQQPRDGGVLHDVEQGLQVCSPYTLG